VHAAITDVPPAIRRAHLPTGAGARRARAACLAPQGQDSADDV